jgi:hypothetical protein
LVGLDLFALHDPVVKVVVEVAISNLEMQVLEDCRVVHQVQAVVHVEAFLLCQDQGVLDQLLQGHRCREVVERITRLKLKKICYPQHVVFWVVHHVRR